MVKAANIPGRSAFGAALLTLLVLLSCLSSKQVDIARRAVEQFHQEVATGQDDAIYDAADDHAYKESVSRETNRGFFSRVRRKMGACTRSTETNYFIDAGTAGTFVRLRYKTQCANGELDELFVWRIEGDRAILVRYEANSPLLLTD